MKPSRLSGKLLLRRGPWQCLSRSFGLRLAGYSFPQSSVKPEFGTITEAKSPLRSIVSYYQMEDTQIIKESLEEDFEKVQELTESDLGDFESFWKYIESLPESSRKPFILSTLKACESKTELDRFWRVTGFRIHHDIKSPFAEPRVFQYGIVFSSHFEMNKSHCLTILATYSKVKDPSRIKNFPQLFSALSIEGSMKYKSDFDNYLFIKLIDLALVDLVKDVHSDDFLKAVYILTNCGFYLYNCQYQIQKSASVISQAFMERYTRGFDQMFPGSKFEIGMLQNYISLFSILDKTEFKIPSHILQEFFDCAFKKLDLESSFFKEILNLMRVLTYFNPGDVNIQRLVCALTNARGLSMFTLESNDIKIYFNFCRKYNLLNFYLNQKNGFYFSAAVELRKTNQLSPLIVSKIKSATEMIHHFLVNYGPSIFINKNVYVMYKFGYKALWTDSSNSDAIRLVTDSNFFEIITYYTKSMNQVSLLSSLTVLLEDLLSRSGAHFFARVDRKKEMQTFFKEFSRINKIEYSFISIENLRRLRPFASIKSFKKATEFTNSLIVQFACFLRDSAYRIPSQAHILCQLLPNATLDKNDYDHMKLVQTIVSYFVSNSSKMDLPTVLDAQRCLANFEKYMKPEDKKIYYEFANSWLKRLSIDDCSLENLISIFEDFRNVNIESSNLEKLKNGVVKKLEGIFPNESQETKTENNLADFVIEEKKFTMFASNESACLPRLLIVLAKYGNFLSIRHFDLLKGFLKTNIPRIIGPQVFDAIEAILDTIPDSHDLIVLVLRNFFTAFPSRPRVIHVRSMLLECYATKELIDFLITRDGFVRLIYKLHNNGVKLAHETEQLAIILMLQIYLNHHQELDLNLLAKVFGILKPACEYEYLGLDKVLSDSWFPTLNLTLENALKIPFYAYNQNMKTFFHDALSKAIANLDYKALSDLLIFCANNRLFHAPLFDTIFNNLEPIFKNFPECLQYVPRLEVPDHYFQSFYTNLFSQFELLPLSISSQMDLMFNFLCQKKYITATQRDYLMPNCDYLRSAVELISEQFIYNEDGFNFKINDKENDLKSFRLITDNSPVLNSVIHEESTGYMRFNFVHREAFKDENKFEIQFAALPTQNIAIFKPYFHRHIFYQEFKSSIGSYFQLSPYEESIISQEFDYLNQNYSNAMRGRCKIKVSLNYATNPTKCPVSKIFYRNFEKRSMLIHPKEDFFTDISDQSQHQFSGSSFAKMLAGSIMEAQPKETIEILTPDQFNDFALDFFAQKVGDKNAIMDLEEDTVREI